MIIDCVADLHSHYPNLEGGDLLIVAGDLTARHRMDEYNEFAEWIGIQKYRKKILIAGNHDEFFRDVLPLYTEIFGVDYLCDSGTEFEYDELEPCNFCGERNKCEQSLICSPPIKKKLKIWGSPWSLTFDGINPRCTAFTGTESDLKGKFALIPEGLDILITHSPLAGILDKTLCNKNVGSLSLKQAVWKMEHPPKIIVHGHIHEAYGEYLENWYEGSEDHFRQRIINCSHVNERYQPVNKPVRVVL